MGKSTTQVGLQIPFKAKLKPTHGKVRILQRHNFKKNLPFKIAIAAALSVGCPLFQTLNMTRWLSLCAFSYHALHIVYTYRFVIYSVYEYENCRYISGEFQCFSPPRILLFEAVEMKK